MKNILIIFVSLLILNNLSAQKWTTYNATDGLISNEVYGIAIDRQSKKWFVTKNGISVFDGKSWTNYPQEPYYVTSVAIDAENNKWFGTYGGGASKFNDTTWITNIGKSRCIRSVYIDAHDNKWFGAYAYNGELWEFDNTNWIHYSPPLAFCNFNAIAVDSTGNLWLGTGGGGAGADKVLMGLHKFDGSSWTILNNDLVKAIVVDSLNNVWTGGYSGIYKYEGSNYTVYKKTDGLPNNTVRALAIDKHGNIWAGTDSGLVKFNGKEWKTFTKADGLCDNEVRSIAIDEQGNKWIGTSSGGVSKMEDNVIVISKDTLIIADTANSSISFIITSNVNWNLSSNQFWLNVSKSSGSNNDTIFLHALSNDSTNARTAIITVSGGGLPSKAITLIQTAAPRILSVSATNINLNDSANSTATFEITSNEQWYVNSDQSWLTLSSDFGKNNDTITVTASANFTNSTRTAIVTVSDNRAISKLIIVRQLVASTGINDISNSDFSLYPIPLINKLIISFPKFNFTTSINIHSLNGLKIYTTKVNNDKIEIDMSKFSSGIYFVKIITMNGILIKKIIKR